MHGGGFYHAQKFKLTPSVTAGHLHWFKWEAYWTWMSGMFLLALIYWYGAEIYLIDPSVADAQQGHGDCYGAGTLVGRLDCVRHALQVAPGADESKLGAVLFLFVVGGGVCPMPRVQRSRRLYSFWRHVGHHHGGECVFCDHAGPAGTGGGRQRGAGAGSRRRSDRQTALGTQHLFHPAGPVRHDQQSLRRHLRHAYNWLILIAISLVGALIRV